jgi:hypothetical protein
VHHCLGLNRNCRLFEIKQACYSGTAAARARLQDDKRPAPGDCCFIHIDRPSASNTINDELISECNRVLLACEDSTKIVVLSGSPEDSGAQRVMGSLRANRPSSNSMSAAVDVIGFVIEAMRNRVSR